MLRPVQEHHEVEVQDTYNSTGTYKSNTCILADVGADDWVLSKGLVGLRI